MKLAYVTHYDSTNVHAWSGLGYFILQALQDNGFQTHRIGNLRVSNRFLLHFKKLYYGRLFHKKYLSNRDPSLLKHYAAQVERALADIRCDLVLSPGTIPVAHLRVDTPIVFWTDATFAGMINYYPAFSNLCAKTIRDGNRMEQLALSKCRLAIYSSDWAANTAIQNYDVDPKKIKVVPFGANLICSHSLQNISSIITNKKFEVCRLLFVGMDWFRKGGDVAVAVAERLNEKGIRTELHIVGVHPPRVPANFVFCHGFISKKTEDGMNRLKSLMTESHFLILPSRAECFGVVFAEASAFGLPSLSTKVG